MIIYPIEYYNNEYILQEIRKIGCDERALPIFSKKYYIVPIKLKNIKPSLANIIKQEMISCKGDAVVNKKSISCEISSTDIILLGTVSIYENFIKKIEDQDYPGLKNIAEQLKNILVNINKNKFKLKTIHNKELNIDKPIIMGILNTTDDSFFDGGKYVNIDNALKRCEEMIKEGAEIIDIGGESTRPGADPIPEDVEINRVIPVVENIYKNFDIIISVDTYKSNVAREAIKSGADIINDISGLTFDKNMINVIKELNAICVIMHIKGKPKNMQINPQYEDVVVELLNYFEERLNYCYNNKLSLENIILDPGIGFGKKLIHNIEIIKNLPAFKKFGLPLMIGVSRKSMIGMLLGDTDKMDEKCIPPENRLFGTLALNFYSMFKGVNIFRVHDIKPHFETFKILKNFIY